MASTQFAYTVKFEITTLLKENTNFERQSQTSVQELGVRTRTGYDDGPPSWYIFRGCIVLLITLAIILSNIINLKIWYNNTNMPSATRYFLLNLSSCDLLVGLVATTSAIYPAFTGTWPYGPVWCQVTGVVHGMSVTLSIWSIAMVGIDRYIAAIKPFTYKHLMSRTRSMWFILIMWFAAAVTFIAPIFTKHDYIYYQYSDGEAMCGLYWEYPAYCIITGLYIPTLSGVVLLFTTCKIHHSLNIQRSRSTDKEKNNSRTKVNKRALIILKATSICYFLHWGPYVVLAQWGVLDKSFHVPGWIAFLALWTANANSFVNVFIYSFTNKHFQKDAKRLFHFLSKETLHKNASVTSDGKEMRQTNCATTPSHSHEHVISGLLTNHSAELLSCDHNMAHSNPMDIRDSLSVDLNFQNDTGVLITPL